MTLYFDIYEGDPVDFLGLTVAHGCTRMLCRAAYGATQDAEFRDYWTQSKSLGYSRQAYQRIKHWPEFQSGFIPFFLWDALSDDTRPGIHPHTFLLGHCRTN